jgi:hypothetical protein
MFQCPFCGDHADSDAATCARCGIAIQWHEGAPTFADPGDSVTLVKVFDPATQPLIESLLEEAGIPYVIQGDVMQDVMGLGRLAGGYNQIFGPPVVKVPQAMLQSARDAIAVLMDRAAVRVSDEELSREAEEAKPE